MYARQSPLNAFLGGVRRFGAPASHRSHYDVLGVGPRATQAEVKAAYYKLSKVYHPDKNQGCDDAATKFRDITAAYEVLGNVRSRRLYDKGVHFDRPSYAHHPAQDDDPKTRFYRSREHRHRPPSMGRTPIYNFDEWSRAHYGATFARDMERKRRAEYVREMRERGENEARVERVVIAFIVFGGLLMYLTRDNFDVDRTFYDSAKGPKPKPERAESP